MAQAVAGSLRVDLALNAGEFEKGAKKAEDRLGGLANKFGITAGTLKTAGLAIGAAFASAAAGIAYTIKQAINNADKMEELAMSAGMTVEQLSRLKFAADVTSVGMDSLGVGIKKLSINIAEIARGDVTGEAARTMAMLGVAVTGANGQMRPTSDILIDIAQKFSMYADGAGKTAAAVKIFGKAGADLIPMLNEGKAGLQEFARQADAFGVTLDSKTAAAAGRFHDNLAKLGHQVDGFGNTLAAKTLPVLVAYTDRMVQVAEQNKIATTSANLLGDAFNGMLAFAVRAENTISSMAASMRALVLSAQSLITMDFGGAAAEIQKSGEAIVKNQIDTNTTLKAMSNDWITTVEANVDSAKKANMGLIESDKALTDGKKLQNEAVAYGKKLAEEYRTPLEQIEFTQNKINDAVNRGTVSYTIAARAMADASVYGRKNMDALASSVSGNLSKIFGDTKAVAIATALINTYLGVTQALATYPPPVSFAMAAIQLAAGIAQVMNIRNQTKNSSSTGSASSGSSAAAATQASAGAGGQQNTLLVQGISANQMFSGDVVRSLAGKLLEYQADGGKVVLA